MNSKNILIAGLPSAGKTTFIAAFWSYIRAFPQDKAIRINTTANTEHEYLNTIADNWMSWVDFGRTINTSGINEIVMNVTNASSGESVILNIPDVKGEIFRINFDERFWTTEFDTMSENLNGVVLFINPLDSHLSPKLIIHQNQLLAALGEKVNNKDKGEIPLTPKSWAPSDTSSQVKLVENLQLLEYYKLRPHRVKLSVIISAWDVVLNDATLKSKMPNEWMSEYVPLLYQYLCANSRTFDVKCFGVSAQGCDYEDTQKRDELIAKEPFERIIVQEENNITNDITKPILWVIG
jgi:hypothetical protein